MNFLYVLVLGFFASGFPLYAKDFDLDKLQIEHFCHANDSKLAFQVGITINYSKPTKETKISIFQVECSLSDHQCEGISINPNSKGKVSFVGMGIMKDAKIVSKVGNVFTIQWGPLRTFTFNNEKGAVSYIESGNSFLTDNAVYGEGKAFCN